MEGLHSFKFYCIQEDIKEGSFDTLKTKYLSKTVSFEVDYYDNLVIVNVEDEHEETIYTINEFLNEDFKNMITLLNF